MRKSGYAIVMFLCGVFLIAGVQAGPAFGSMLDDCLDVDMDSCDFLGFSKMCHALASNPQPCSQLCKSVYSGDTVGDCLRCCEQVIPQLGMDPQWQVEPE